MQRILTGPLMVVAAIGLASSAAQAAQSTGSSIPSLVNVDLRNVLNNLSVALHISKSNIPVTIQLPVTVAANVCGVSVNVLSASVASGQGSCTATTGSPELVQIVSQQMATNGSVGGGAQGGSTVNTNTTTATPPTQTQPQTTPQ